jgi:hypothetical protein
VNNDCVGCGLCGEVAHAAQLCPSFYRLDVIRNPSRLDLRTDRNWSCAAGGRRLDGSRPPARAYDPAE